MTFRIGFDVGGTFTDVAVLDESSGALTIAKSSTTPQDHVQGILNTLNKIPINKGEVSYLVHGTTIVTNAIVQRKLPRVALITTKGFRDVLEIMRENRPIWGLYDIKWDKPKPLIPRHLRFEVDERVDYKGNVLEALDVEGARQLVRKLKTSGVVSVAVCLMSSYMNGEHEKQLEKIIHKEAPGVLVSLSSEVNPQIREYERTSTTAIDASVKPLAAQYFNRLEKVLTEAGFKATLLIMKSSGGLTSAKSAANYPVQTIESGPAGGTMGSVYVGHLANYKNLVAIDMGGTTFKVSIIHEGVPRTRSEGEIEWGVPYRLPMIDISEIGAGGGSIAHLDREGGLRVGPISAGAEPGPVCYQAGGKEPTFTDACVALGYTNPEYLLGGEMKIDKKAAEKAIQAKIAKPLGLDTIEAAQGIVEISNQAMLGSMRVASVERGFDPRDFATIAYGGAGPMVAGFLSQELGSPLLIVPPHPGIFSAIGMLLSDVRLDFMRPFRHHLGAVDLQKMSSIYDALEKEAVARLRGDFRDLEYRIIRSADMRYVGQNYEVSSVVPGGPIVPKSLQVSKSNFAHEHEKMYGHAKGGETEFVNLRVTIIGTIHKPRIVAYQEKPRSKNPVSKETRSVFFPGRHGSLKTEVYDRALMAPGVKIRGPAIIEEISSTTVVYPKQSLVVDRYGNLLIETR
ncbi:MAG: hydantoinase/oxoprolinase family protein [Thaumarchaeota archaeon]|nr:hydantoinase/oxoprolinase family protein [Nitrososphaerota archaeon]